MRQVHTPNLDLLSAPAWLSICKQITVRLQVLGPAQLTHESVVFENYELAYVWALWIAANAPARVSSVADAPSWRFETFDERAMAFVWLSRQFIWDIRIHMPEANLTLRIDHHHRFSVASSDAQLEQRWVDFLKDILDRQSPNLRSHVPKTPR
jgi:hypothetical protein